MADGDSASPEVNRAVMADMMLALRNAGMNVAAGPGNTINVYVYINDTETELVFVLAVTSEEVPF